jgi:hypothetical protein
MPSKVREWVGVVVVEDYLSYGSCLCGFDIMYGRAKAKDRSIKSMRPHNQAAGDQYGGRYSLGPVAPDSGIGYEQSRGRYDVYGDVFGWQWGKWTAELLR